MTNQYQSIIDSQIAELQKVIDDGLPIVYKEPVGFITDWGMNFCWEPARGEYEREAVLESKEFQIVAKDFNQTFGFDIEADLRMCMDEMRKNP